MLDPNSSKAFVIVSEVRGRFGLPMYWDRMALAVRTHDPTLALNGAAQFLQSLYPGNDAYIEGDLILLGLETYKVMPVTTLYQHGAHTQTYLAQWQAMDTRLWMERDLPVIVNAPDDSTAKHDLIAAMHQCHRFLTLEIEGQLVEYRTPDDRVNIELSPLRFVS